jgi:hypothetical protein
VITPAITVRLRDQFNNLVLQSGVAVSVTTTTTLNGTTTTNTNTSGIAAFDNLFITTTGTYALTSGSGALIPTTSNNLNITAAAAASLAWQTQPQTTTANAAMPAFTVRVQDQYGNNVAGATVGITTTNSALTLYQSGVLVTGYAVTDSAATGLATFNTISMTAVGTGYAFTATSGALSAASTAFNINPANSDAIYIGGTGDGWSQRNGGTSAAPNEPCYISGEGDGWDQRSTTPPNNDPVYIGGTGDGWDWRNGVQ